MTRASLDKQPHEVASMFDDVAAKYDLTNDVLSLGQARLWRRAVARAVDARPGQRVLDLAAGTATSSVPFAEAGRWSCPATSPRHAQEGKRRHPGFPLTAGDATRLPFADDVFDAVTISFGLRNVQDTEAALREMLRVTKPGGRVVICEFSHPTWAPFRTVYSEYLMRALPPVATAVSSNPEAYVYLADSIRAWPDQRGSPRSCRVPAGSGSPGATSPAGSSPCTAATRPLRRAPPGARGSSRPGRALGYDVATRRCGTPAGWRRARRSSAFSGASAGPSMGVQRASMVMPGRWLSVRSSSTSSPTPTPVPPPATGPAPRRGRGRPSAAARRASR
ncbi:class I SAM-dependent methyltransferase [Streptacidiphilus monticola]